MARENAGRRILVTEDEFLFADDIHLSLARLGVRTIGPAATVERALHLIERSDRVDGAILDINLRGKMVFPVADALKERGIPFLFATGYDESVIPPRYRDVPLWKKPLDPDEVVQALLSRLNS
jgi:CheY-like chemotaxis protein